MALHIDEEVQGYLDRGWFPYEDDTYALMLDKRQRAFYTRALVMWEQSGCRYFSRQQIEKLMTETGYQSPANALAAFIRNGVFHEVELVEGHMLYALSAFPFKQRNDRDAEMKVWQMSKNHGISRTGTIWCLPDDTEPVALDLSVADFYGLFVRQSTKTADIRLRKGRLMAEINQCFHCADESATERFYRLLQEDGLFRYASMDHDILIIRPYKIGMDGEVIIPAMCQKVPKAEVDEPSAQELDLALEPEVSVCEEVDMDEGEDLRLALPDDIMDYEITELRALLDRLEEALEQEARQIVTFSPLSTIEQIVVGNEEGLDDILDRAQLLWKISKAAGVVSSALVELRSARDHLMRQIATYNEFDQGEE